MSSINWQAIGTQAFNVLDPNYGFWSENGFVRDQHKAKTYTQDQLTDSEHDSIKTTSCTLMSA